MHSASGVSVSTTTAQTAVDTLLLNMHGASCVSWKRMTARTALTHPRWKSRTLQKMDLSDPKSGQFKRSKIWMCPGVGVGMMRE